MLDSDISGDPGEIRDPELSRILVQGKRALAQAADDDAALAIIAATAAELERRGDDGSDAVGELSDHAIHSYGMDPDDVQDGLVQGQSYALEARGRTQPKRKSGHYNGHAGAIGQGPNGIHQKPEPKPAGAKLWNERLLKARVLKSKTFEPLRFVLPDIVPEGATLLVSRPKLGKSWLVLDLAFATAAGRFTLGDLKPSQGAVLYVALEDSERRLQRRMDKLLLGEWPEQLEFATEWPRADQGGLADIEEWIKARPNARLVIVDTLAHFRPLAPGKTQGGYQDDYAALAPLQKLAGKYGVAILVVHHDRKMEADDVFDTISGTLGLTGAVDTMLVMKRQAGNVTLHVRGRDIEEAEKAIQFSKDTCRWTIIGEAAEVNRSEQRGRVMDALRRCADGLSPAEFATEIDITRENAKKILRRMAEGDVEHREKGRYGVVSPLSPRAVPGTKDSNIIYLRGDSDGGDTGDTGDSGPKL